MFYVSEYYGSDYLNGDDLDGKTYRLQISHVSVEEIGYEGQKKKRLVIGFAKFKKCLILNKTNAIALANGAGWGDDANAWIGRSLEAFTQPVTVDGRTCNGIRVRPVSETTTKLVTPVATNGDATPMGAPPAAAGSLASSEDVPF